MTLEDRARYVGEIGEYANEEADIKPHFDSQHLELEERKVLVRWCNPYLVNHKSLIGQQVGSVWHLMPAKDFKILVRA